MLSWLHLAADGVTFEHTEANQRLYGRTATAHGILRGLYAAPAEFLPLFTVIQDLVDAAELGMQPRGFGLRTVR